MVSHGIDLIEHPELLADRIVTFAELLGRENVINDTDRGRGGSVHSQIAWAKLHPCATARDRQEIVELNSKVPVRDERNKKQESLEVKV